MNERRQPDGTPESQPTPGSEPPPTEPIGWPERPADATEPTTAMPTADVPPPATTPPPPPPQTAQPAVQWQAPAAAVVVPGAKPRRTTLSAIAGIILLALGIIGLLFGVLFLAGGAMFSQLIAGFDQIPGLPEGVTPEQVIGGVFAFFGVIIIAYSVLYVIGGIGVLRSSDFGRIMGIIVAILSGLIWVGGLSSGQEPGMEGGFGFALVMFLVHLYVFFVLAFKWREPAPPVAAPPPA